MRGYKNTLKKFPHLVTPLDSATLVGDEAAMHAFAGKAVLIDANRKRGIDFIETHTQHDVILAEDGFLSLPYKPALSILLVDLVRKFGNGWLFPCGPLRCGVDKLKQADVISYISQDKNTEAEKKFQESYGHLHTAEIAFCKGVNDSLRLGEQRYSWESFLQEFGQEKIVCLLALAQPERLQEIIAAKTCGRLNLQYAIFPDHHRYSSQEIDALGSFDKILTTQKDAVKLQALTNLSEKKLVIMEYDLILCSILCSLLKSNF